MRVLKRDCRDCGGDLAYKSGFLVCLSCPWKLSTINFTPQQKAKLDKDLVEIEDSQFTRMTIAGKFLLTGLEEDSLVGRLLMGVHLLKDLKDGREMTLEEISFLASQGLVEPPEEGEQTDG